MTTTTAPATPVPDADRTQFADRTIHFVGIGGCGMSGLARLLQQLGARCSGSDSAPSDITAALIHAAIPVTHEQIADSLPADTDLVIASAAIRPDHPELLAAQTRGIPIMSYAEALGAAQMHRTGVSIAGTHGKSTTTAMLCHTLLACGLDPSFIVGATCPQLEGGSRCGAATVPGHGPFGGAPGYLIAEACEFNRSFHHHRPTIGAINNVEEDHLDIYGSIDQIVEAFAEFARLIPDAEHGGHLIIAHEGAHRRAITAGLNCGISTFGFSPAATFQVFMDAATSRIGLLQDGHWLAQWTNAMPGEHNALNSALAGILAHRMGGDWDDIAAALNSFRGLDRRMQRLGPRRVDGGEVIVYDDYGHHPTEIDTTLRAIRLVEKPKRMICVFQPHQHSRTRFLLEEFAQSFSSADVVIVPHIYFVRDSEIEKQRVSACDLVDRLRQRGVTAMHLYPFDAIAEQLDVIARPDDVIVVMGAGPVWQVARRFRELERT
ncbi:MAG: UDP-N-acetylmuramate--L-alanine ligase [Phycisphaerales bacterium]|nr:UDP-N-acetylmuramate--L-alanine ligase [Phycisphaerales bacterium]